ncbi:MAG: TIGR00266 family protein [Uliginosibacterium sp.]|jgi:uncharacterized protein (TIGR00266 family)|nr:TIGR00266 family protein [Uliginosibacterium sp.]MBK9393620.1 TIGR00266 family protein [Uliginosibacterium sp.]MBK9614004.1 TIGR00266 family protein [Uliginosibacterium sp.]
MQIEFMHQPGNTAARIALRPGETLTAEAGAMIAMSGHLGVSTSTHKKGKGGLLKAAKRLFAGESFFLNHFSAEREAGEVWLGSALAGDMMQYELDRQTLIVESGAFVACAHQVDIDVGWQGFKNLLSGESLFWLKLSGQGPVILNAFGSIYPIEVDGEYIVDTGHIVAFNETLDFSLTKAGKSWVSSMLGGEGLVCKFRGRGTVWCQSHNPKSFGKSFGSSLKPRRA